MRRLCSTMHNQVEAIGFEQFVQRTAVPDIEIFVLKILSGTLQPLQIPSCVALRTKKNLAHVVVDTKHPMTLPVEMLHCFGADQSTAAGDQYCFHISMANSDSLRSPCLFSPNTSLNPCRLPDSANVFPDHRIVLLAAKCFGKNL